MKKIFALICAVLLIAINCYASHSMLLKAQPEGVYPFQGPSVSMVIVRANTMTVPDCPFRTWTIPTLPDCPGGAPHNVVCVNSCISTFNANMTALADAYCPDYEAAWDEFTNCINDAVSAKNICLQTNNEDFCNSIYTNDCLDCAATLAEQLAAVRVDYNQAKIPIIQSFFDCGSHCCP